MAQARLRSVASWFLSLVFPGLLAGLGAAGVPASAAAQTLPQVQAEAPAQVPAQAPVQVPAQAPAQVQAQSQADKKAAVTAHSLPATSGVRSEAQTTLAAPAERVAELIADPHNFVPLFPAHAVDVLSAAADLQVVSVEMRKPWPVGTVKWVEDVVKRREPDGKTFVIQRTAHPGYFKHMSARFHVAPDPAAESQRCIVTYEVEMELKRWVPEWALRRGNLNGIVDTMTRLRNLVAAQERAPAAASAHQ